MHKSNVDQNHSEPEEPGVAFDKAQMCSVIPVSGIGALSRACKYGENAWQKPAGLYRAIAGALSQNSDPLALDKFNLLIGEPSYNNLCDVDRMLQTMTHTAAGFDVNYGKVPYIAIGVKHGNPCGAAFSPDPHEALSLMLRGDRTAIFGGAVMTNFPIDKTGAEILRFGHAKEGEKRPLECVVAPTFDDDAIRILERKGQRCRMFANPALAELAKDSLDIATRFRYVRGGFLAQPNYTFVLNLEDERIEKVGTLSENAKKSLVLAWAVGSTSTSNTITIVRPKNQQNGYLIANAIGQQDRVGAACLACTRASREGHSLRGSVAYSDSFFPFPDAPEFLLEAGVQSIFASSGSVRDEEVKGLFRDWNDELGEKPKVTFWLMPDADVRGFFGH